ncbi:carotenoid oxygenase family protein [Myxococcota bacterium]|nr:carotenoid oxygenase family protein [Myxococcota bacterium]
MAVWVGRGFVGGEHGRVDAFDGLPKLHSIRLHDGCARLHTRFIRNDVYRRAMARGYLEPFITVSPRVSGRSSWRPRHALRAASASGTGALEIQRVHGRFIVGYEGSGYTAEVDVETLETLGEHVLRPRNPPWRVVLGSAFIPSASDGTAYATAVTLELWRPGARPRLEITSLDPDLRAAPFEVVELDAVVDIHNIAVTERFVVAVICPERMDLLRLTTAGNALAAIEARAGATNLFLVWDRRSGRLLRRISSRFHFSFNHVVRATEIGATVRLDLVENTSPTARITVPGRPTDPFVMGGAVVRYDVDLARGEVLRSEVFAGPCEMPAAERADGPAYANYFADVGGVQAWGLASIYDGRTFLPSNGWRVMSSPVVRDGLVHVLACDAQFERFAWWALDGASFELVADVALPEPLGLVAHGSWFDLPDAPTRARSNLGAPSCEEGAVRCAEQR